MNNGWISVHRKILCNPVLNRSRKFSNFEAFVVLLLKANHKPNKVRVGNSMIEVDSGELITSQKKLCTEFRWSSSKLRAFLKLLESEQMIKVKTNKVCTMLSICNYKELQSIENHKRTTKESQKNHKRKQTISNKVNNTALVDREVEFKNKILTLGLEFEPPIQSGTINAFCNYWTESNKRGSKMRFESEKFFDPKKRLATWLKREDSYGIKSKQTIQQKYQTNGNGEFKVWCVKCGRDLYYKEHHIKMQTATACCKTDFRSTKK